MKNQNNSETTKEIVKYRIWLSKKEDAKYLSHHDIALLLQQAIRKADLPVALSGDFNPRMKVSFHTSVAVGIACEGEPVDIVLFKDIGAGLLVEKLQKKLPTGMDIVKADKILPSKTKFFLKIVYSVNVSRTIPPEKIVELMSSSSLIVTRYKENETKKVDIRPYILECSIQKSLPESSTLSLATAMTPQGSVQVWEVLEQLGLPKEESLSISMTRTSVDFVPLLEATPS